MTVVTVQEMRALEAAADRAGLSYAQMMDTAGHAVAEQVKRHLAAHPKADVVCLIGMGNNGGDGLVAGRLLAEETPCRVRFVLLGPRDDDNFRKVTALNLPLIAAQEREAVVTAARECDIIIDALLGTGIRLPLRDDVRNLLQAVRAGLETRSTPPVVIAVDLPSGLDADTGAIAPETLPATVTVTFEALKPGHVCYPGVGVCGHLDVAPLNLPAGPKRPPVREVITPQRAAALLPRRPVDANKGTFGKALVVAGSTHYIGASLLAGEAAYRAGAGLVTVATPAPNVRLLSPRLLEATWLPLTHQRGAIDESAADIVWEQFGNYTAALVGPGLGMASATAAFIDVLFAADESVDPLPTTYPDPPIPRFDDVIDRPAAPPKRTITPPPLVIDADGLNLLADLNEWPKRLPANTILTPHPGEMARLAGITPESSRSAAQIVQGNRFHLALDSAKKWQCVVLLKGANTLVAAPDGRLLVIPVATPALARAGTGDVLAGVVVGLLAQRLAPFEAATLGAYLHAQAGLIAAERLGTVSSVLASDVIAALPAAIHAIEQLG